MLANIQQIHFIGIGGAGLSAIAKVLLEQGKRVSGSDLALSPLTDALAKMGAQVFQGHQAIQLGHAELVVISSAVRADNPELIAAQARAIPVIKRDVLLGELMADKIGIGVAGTAGKTTTTAMLAHVLSAMQRDPTFIVGGVLANWGTNARAGRGAHFVIEADEYDRMFLGLRPKHAIVTNIEFDHPDCFADEAAIVEAFKAFVSLPSLAARQSTVMVCGDSPNTAQLHAGSAHEGPDVVSYGFGEWNDYRIIDPQVDPHSGTTFVIVREHHILTRVQLQTPGRHNMQNACAVVALGERLGLDVTQVARALAGFQGVLRRFELKGERDGVTIIDDYAHHPTKVRATLEAARERFGARRIWAVFQPHTYSRTKALLNEFANAFDLADEVIVSDIYAARERETLGIHSLQLVERMNNSHVHYVPTLDEIIAYLRSHVRAGDVVLTLGAGDVTVVGAGLLET